MKHLAVDATTLPYFRDIKDMDLQETLLILI